MSRRNRSTWLLALPCALLLLAGCSKAAPPAPTPSPAAQFGTPNSILSRAQPGPMIEASPGLPVLTFTTQSGGKAYLAVQIEAMDPGRQRGLMGVTQLPADQGQIFVFHDVNPTGDVKISFWMKDTLIPLSIAFISVSGVVQEIQDMQPQTLTLHTPKVPYRYAVEANQGWFAQHHVVAGATVDLSPVLARL